MKGPQGLKIESEERVFDFSDVSPETVKALLKYLKIGKPRKENKPKEIKVGEEDEDIDM